MKRIYQVGVALLALELGLCAQDTCAAGELYDDGTAEATVGFPYAGPDGVYTVVSRFTPASYPHCYHRVCAELGSLGGPLEYAMVVFNDNGPGGMPGTEMAAVPDTVVSWGGGSRWISADIGCVTVLSGSVWIGVRSIFSPAPVRLDQSASHPSFTSTQFTGWVAGPAGTPMVRAEGAHGTGVARATLRNGSGGNPLSYQASRPIVGQAWSASVAHSSSASWSAILFQAAPASGPIVPAGELLVDLSSPRLFTSLRVATGTADAHTQSMPNDSALIGLALSSQAVVREPAGLQLCNAYDLVVGCR